MGIVIKFLNFLKPLDEFCDFEAKKSDFYVILITLRTF